MQKKFSSFYVHNNIFLLLTLFLFSPTVHLRLYKEKSLLFNKVAGVPGSLSSRPNWVRPPLYHKRGVLPPFGSGGAHSLEGEGVGGPKSDEGTDTVVRNTSTVFFYLKVNPK